MFISESSIIYFSVQKPLRNVLEMVVCTLFSGFRLWESATWGHAWVIKWNPHCIEDWYNRLWMNILKRCCMQSPWKRQLEPSWRPYGRGGIAVAIMEAMWLTPISSPGTLRPREHFVPGTLCPQAHFIPGHTSSPGAFRPRNTSSPEHFVPGTLRPRHISSPAHFVPGTLRPHTFRPRK